MVFLRTVVVGYTLAMIAYVLWKFATHQHMTAQDMMLLNMIR